MKLTRRSFLKLTAAAGAAAACRADSDTGRSPTLPGSTPTSRPTTSTNTETTPPDQDRVADLERFCDSVLAWLRADPSHRVQRAADAVAAGDVTALFELVRDQVRLQPGLTHLTADRPAEGLDPHANGWGCLFGPRGTLRGGAGLARDKVELLADLLRRAGEDAEVVWVESSLGPADAVACRSVTPLESELEVPDELLAEWEALLQVDLRELEEGDAIDEAAVDALADQLLALVPPSTTPYVDGIDGSRLPMVRWNSAPGAPILCPLHPDATVDDPVLPVGDALPAAAEETPTVEIVLSGWRAGEEQPVTLVSGSFHAADLAGRQLLVGTHPVATIDELLSAEVGDSFEAFQPYLGIQAMDDEPTPEPVFGTVITTSGSTVTTTSTGGLRFDDAVEVGGGDVGDPSSVATVDLEIDAIAFPRVTVRAWPRDASGVLVEGLGRDALQLTEEGKGTAAVLRADRGDVRVLLLWDLSTSMPPAYADAEDSGWLADIAAVLRAARPDMTLTVTTFLLNQAETIAAAVADPARFDRVLVVTDGETLEDPEHFAPLVAGGPPVFLADVLDAAPDLHVELAAASGGTTPP